MAGYANEWHPHLSTLDQALANDLVQEYRAPYSNVHVVTDDEFITDTFYMHIQSLREMRAIAKLRMKQASLQGSYWIQVWFNVLKGQIDPLSGSLVPGTAKHWASSEEDTARGFRRNECCQWMSLDGVMVSDSGTHRLDERKVLSQLTMDSMRQKLQNFAFSRTQLLGITGMRIKTTRTNFAMGAPIVLPDFLLKKGCGLRPMLVPGNLCFWACLAIAKGCRRDRWLSRAKELLRSCGGDPVNYAGFHYSEENLRFAEEKCKVSINIYSKHIENGLTLLRRASEKYMKVHLHRFETHFSLITDIRLFGAIYRCPHCPKLFETKKKLYKHEQRAQCAKNTAESFQKDSLPYEPRVRPLTQFLLKSRRPTSMRSHWKYVICYDWESMLKRVLERNNKNLKLINIHTPMSVSIVSNVPGFDEPKFLYDDDAIALTKSFFKYLHEIRAKVFKMEMKYFNILTSEEKKEFSEMFAVPVLGFNSGGYDIPLLAKTGFWNLANPKFVLKKSNNYPTVRCENGLLFLDAMQYMPMGTSLVSYLKLWQVKTTKFFYPYTYYDTTEKLLDASLGCPPREAFYNDLKKIEMSENDYHLVQTVWYNRNFKCGRDLLEYYNNLDVVPFLKAVLTHRDWYLSFNLDMFIDGMTLSGMADHLRESELFKPPNYAHEHSMLLSRLHQQEEQFRYAPCERLLERKIGGYRLQDQHRLQCHPTLSIELDWISPSPEEGNNEYRDKLYWLMTVYNDIVGVGLSLNVQNEGSWNAGMWANHYSLTTPYNLDFVRNINALPGLRIYTKKGLDPAEILQGEGFRELSYIPKFVLESCTSAGFSHISRNPQYAHKYQIFGLCLFSSLQHASTANIEDGELVFRCWCRPNHRMLLDSPYVDISWFSEQISWQGGRCFYCWCELDNKNLTADRINNDLAHTQPNCVLSCIACNCAKGDGSHMEFLHKMRLIRLDQVEPQIWVLDESRKEIFHNLQKSVVGGPSIVFHRRHVAGETSICHPVYDEKTEEWGTIQGNLVAEIVSYDANALYAYAMTRGVLCGQPRESKEMNPEQLVEALRSGELYGIAKVDLHVPKELWSHFGEFCPIFTHRTIWKHELSPEMQKLATMERTSKLVSALSATEIWLHTDLLLWYIQHGLIVTKVYGANHFKRGDPFLNFVGWCTEQRREGDRLGGEMGAATASKAKFHGNAAFGRTVMNRSKHDRQIYTQDKTEAMDATNDIHFRSVRKLADSLWEITYRKKSFCQNLPFQVGAAIYQIAKLRMLEFYYDCLDKYIHRDNFQLCYMDTDSFWLALAGPLESLIKPEMVEEWMEDRHNWFSGFHDSEAENLYQSRTPGLFKVEFEATSAVWLTAKCYYAENSETKKLSCKGVNKTANRDLLKLGTYESTLESGVPMMVKNPGIHFRKVDNMYTMAQFEQTKIGLNAFYDKRHVLEDGVSTVPMK